MDTAYKLPALSEKELAVAELAACGLTNLQIAHALNAPMDTVRHQLHRVFVKLGVNRRWNLDGVLRPVSVSNVVPKVFE